MQKRLKKSSAWLKGFHEKTWIFYVETLRVFLAKLPSWLAWSISKPKKTQDRKQKTTTNIRSSERRLQTEVVEVDCLRSEAVHWAQEKADHV